MSSISALFFILLGILGLSPAGQAKSACSVRLQGLVIQADQCDRDTDSDTLELNGHVQIVYRDQHISCDRTSVNFRARSLDAQGQVIITSPQATLGGSRILLDYETNTGMIFDGFVQSGPVLFEGENISKLGDSEYLATSAKFTACDNCPESWSFTGHKIRAQLGGYAFIKNSFLRVGGIPVLWLPYLIVPLKSDRQTGLLSPDFETSDSGGLTGGLSFFWAMDRSQDATISLKNYEKRGLKGLVNYRYTLSENSLGELDLGFIRDRAFGSDPRLNSFRPPGETSQPINRWFARYQHYLELPEGYVHRLVVNNASDLQYGKDFPLETGNHGDPAMENRMSLTKNTDGHHFSVDSSYYVNLLQYDPISSNNDAVHRAPEIRYSKTLSKISSSDWLYSLDLNSTHFNRAEFGYDDLNAAYDPNGTNDRHLDSTGSATDCSGSEWYNNTECSRVRDGKFDPGKDLLRTGHRLDMRGTLMRPYRFGDFFDVIPKISYRETMYQFNIDENAQNTRRFLRAELATKSLFTALYGDPQAARGTRYKHEFQPDVTLTTIPWLSQPSHPFFGSQQEVPYFSQETVSDSDLNSPYGLQFDFNDRVYDRKLVTLGLTNKLIEKRWKEGRPDYRQILSWRVSQSYDLYQQESNNTVKHPFSDILSDLRVSLDSIELYSRANYFPYQTVTNVSNRLRYNFPTGDFLQIAHVQNYQNISPGKDIDPGRRAEEYTFSIRKTFPFGDILGQVRYDPNPIDDSQRIKSYGYIAQIKLPGDCWYFNLQQYRTVGGENYVRGHFDFIWDGQKRPPLPESLLDAMGF